MARIRLEVNGESARATVTEGILTHGAVGVEIDVIVTGTQWDGIPYHVICISNGVAMPALPIDGTATVPHERLVGGAHLYLGIDGSNQPGTLRIPTILADCGTVATSPAKYDPEHPAPPTPDIYAQIMAAIEAGKIRGKDGYSPTVGVQLIDGGYRITITDKDGPKSFDLRNGRDGEPGKDYILTDADKQQIADMVPGYDDTEIKRDQIELKEGLTQCLKEPDGMAVGKYFRVAAIDEKGHAVLEAVDAPAPDLTNYVKNTDYASVSNPGLVMVSSNGYATVMRGANSEYIACASKTAQQYASLGIETFISKGTLQNVLAAPSIQPALTAEEQLAGRQRLGMDKEWTLVGTITTENKDEGVTVDLTGCTELVIYGVADGTGTSNFSGYVGYGILVFNGLVANGHRHIYAHYADTFWGIDCVKAAYSNNNDLNVVTPANGYSWWGLYTGSISRFYFNSPANVTSCDIKIYAR